MTTKERDAREGVIAVGIRVPKDRAAEIKQIAKRMLLEHRLAMLKAEVPSNER